MSSDGFCCSSGPLCETPENRTIDKELDLVLELRKGTLILVVFGKLRTDHEGLAKETGGTGDQRKNQYHPDHSNVKIPKDT